MNNSLKLLLWSLVGPYEQSGGEFWLDRLPTVGEVLKSDAYDFIVLPGVSAPKTSEGGGSMLADLLDYMPDFSFTYTRHMPQLQVSEGIVICHRHSRWEADINGGFRVWPPNTIRAIFCVLFHELDEDKKRTGRAVYLASSQIHNDVMRDAVITQMLMLLSQRPQPEYPVIWAGDTGITEPPHLHSLIGQIAPPPGQTAAAPAMPLQDVFSVLHPEAAHVVSTNNWLDTEGEGIRRDFVLISDGLSPQSLDFNYIRTPAGRFPSNHYPQRAVLSFNDRPVGQLLN